jgi:hypothetical protein
VSSESIPSPQCRSAPPAPLPRPAARCVIEQEVAQGREQERSKAPALAVDVPEVLALDEIKEEGLGRVLRIFNGVALLTDVVGERIPVEAVEGREGALRGRRVITSDCEHERPAGRVKAVAADYRHGGRMVAPDDGGCKDRGTGVALASLEPAAGKRVQ